MRIYNKILLLSFIILLLLPMVSADKLRCSITSNDDVILIWFEGANGDDDFDCDDKDFLKQSAAKVIGNYSVKYLIANRDAIANEIENEYQNKFWEEKIDIRIARLMYNTTDGGVVEHEWSNTWWSPLHWALRGISTILSFIFIIIALVYLSDFCSEYSTREDEVNGLIFWSAFGISLAQPILFVLGITFWIVNSIFLLCILLILRYADKVMHQDCAFCKKRVHLFQAHHEVYDCMDGHVCYHNRCHEKSEINEGLKEKDIEVWDDVVKSYYEDLKVLEYLKSEIKEIGDSTKKFVENANTRLKELDVKYDDMKVKISPPVRDAGDGRQLHFRKECD